MADPEKKRKEPSFQEKPLFCDQKLIFSIKINELENGQYSNKEYPVPRNDKTKL